MIRLATRREISAQKELLLLCARPITEDAGTRIRDLAVEGLDWAGVLVAATENGMAPLLCQHLGFLADEVLPPLWRDQFREEFAANTRRSLFLSSELLRILDALDACGVRATPYKGPVLAVQAYGDIALRQFGDLDIIVPQAEILEAHRALAGLAFHPTNPQSDPQVSRQVPGQYAYSNEICGTHIELHTESTLRYVPMRLDLEPLLARREALLLANRELRTFSPEDSLVLLAVHGSKHFWDRLGWIADIAALAQSFRGLDWEMVMERARSLGAERMVLLGAGLAHDLLDAPLTDRVASLLERDSVTRRLKEGISRQFFAPRPLRLGVLSRFAFRAQTCGAIRNGLLYALRLAVTPTEADRNGALRPLRLARLYGWRTRISKVASIVPTREFLVDVARRILTFAEVCPDDSVLDLLTDSGQLAILAARSCGAAGVGIVPDAHAVAEAKIVARALGVSACVRFFEQYLEIPDLRGFTILFLGADAFAHGTLGLQVEAAILRGMRVVSMGGDIPGRAPAREISLSSDGGQVVTLKLWKAIPTSGSGSSVIVPSSTAARI
jgi:Uncharacterised nucleotidyltransferase